MADRGTMIKRPEVPKPGKKASKLTQGEKEFTEEVAAYLAAPCVECGSLKKLATNGSWQVNTFVGSWGHRAARWRSAYLALVAGFIGHSSCATPWSSACTAYHAYPLGRNAGGRFDLLS